MNKIINNNQLGFNTNKKIGKITTKILCKIIGIDKLNALLEEIGETQNLEELCDKILEKQNIKIALKANNIKNCVKKNQAQIIVCNLPHGAIDAIIMLSTILKIRKDVKIIGNELLQNIKPLENYILRLDKPRSQKISAQNIQNIREIKKHCHNNGIIIVFPALKVATFQKGLSGFKDKKWNEKIIKLINKTNCKIVPFTICGRNNWRFHTLAKIHPKLAELSLINEMLRTQNETIDVLVGKPFENTEQLKKLKAHELEKLLRGNMILLRNVREEQYQKENDIIKETQPDEGKIVDKKDKKIENKTGLNMKRTLSNIMKETAGIEMMNFDEKLKIYETDEIIGFLIEKKGNPEITKLANDNFKKRQNNNHKNCVVVVDKKNKEIIALVEIGYGDKIVKAQGVDGFYCFEDYDFNHKLVGMLSKSVEIGQMATIDKNLNEIRLWEHTINCVREIIAKNSKYSSIIVGTDVCDSDSYTARRLVVNQLMEYDYDKKYRKLVTPHNNLSRLENPILDRQSIEVISKVGAFEHFIADADHDYVSKDGVLRLITQYGGKIMGINSSGSEGEGAISVLVNIPKK